VNQVAHAKGALAYHFCKPSSKNDPREDSSSEDNDDDDDTV